MNDLLFSLPNFNVTNQMPKSNNEQRTEPKQSKKKYEKADVKSVCCASVGIFHFHTISQFCFFFLLFHSYEIFVRKQLQFGCGVNSGAQ